MAGYGSDPYGTMPYGTFIYIFVPGYFKNPSFEIASSLIGGAIFWDSDSDTNTLIAGVDTEENKFEDMQWHTYSTSPTWTDATYSDDKTYDDFEWGTTIETFQVTPDSSDDFGWYIYNPIFITDTIGKFDSGVDTYEDLQWYTYSTVFVVDDVAMFDAGANQYEDFGGTWT